MVRGKRPRHADSWGVNLGRNLVPVFSRTTSGTPQIRARLGYRSNRGIELQRVYFSGSEKQWDGLLLTIRHHNVPD